MNDLAVSRKAAEDDVAFFELYHHVLYFPVHIPCLKYENTSIYEI